MCIPNFQLLIGCKFPEFNEITYIIVLANDTVNFSNFFPAISSTIIKALLKKYLIIQQIFCKHSKKTSLSKNLTMFGIGILCFQNTKGHHSAGSLPWSHEEKMISLTIILIQYLFQI